MCAKSECHSKESESRSMISKPQLIAAWLVTVVFGVGIVVIEMDVSMLITMAWLILFAAYLIRTKRVHGIGIFRRVLAMHLLTMALLVTLASLAPVKRIDHVKRQMIHLPQREITVAELSEECRDRRKEWPLRVHLPDGERAQSTVLHFSSESMPLGQFITEVENATGLQSRFGGCGNAGSILYGQAYNFGLSFDPPDRRQSEEWDR